WVKGSHSLRFGYHMERVQVNHWEDDWAFGPRGEFFFSGATTSLNGGLPPNAYNAWADWLLGQPNRMGKDTLDPQLSTTVRVLNEFFYARDIWQAARKLTVEYGVRFERYPYATTRSHGSVNYDAVTNTSSIGGIGGVPRNAYVDTGIGQLLPRVGVAYRVGDKTVIRAGFGLNSDPQNFWTELYIYPTIISASQVGPNSYVPAGSLATGLAPVVFPDLSKGKIQLPAIVGTDGNVANYRVGYTESYNLTVQRDVGK